MQNGYETISHYLGPTPYLWFESVMISPATGIINSPSIPIITVNNGDVIEMSVFSHTSGTNPRNYPTLNFVSDQGSTTMQILESATNDAWHRVSAICGVTATCCRTYPCSGYVSNTSNCNIHSATSQRVKRLDIFKLTRVTHYFCSFL